MKAYRFKTGGYVASDVQVHGVKPLHRAIFSDDGKLLSLEATVPSKNGDGARDAGMAAYRTVPKMFDQVVATSKQVPEVEDVQGVIAAHAYKATRAWWNSGLVKGF